MCLHVILHSVYINSRKTTGSPFKTVLESDHFLLSPILLGLSLHIFCLEFSIDL